MKRSALMVTAVAFGAATLAPVAGAKTVTPPKMTCEEFLALGEDIQPRAVAWLDGYSAAGKLKEQDVGEVVVDRQTEDLVVVCKQDPKVTFWDKLKAKFPGGKKKVKPVPMTCEEFVATDDSIKPEAVYYAAGYHAGVEKGAVAEVDLERDIGVVVVECKATPKESFWTKVKNVFHKK